MSIFLETSRLIIKKSQLSDLDFSFALQSDPEVMKYVGSGARPREEVQMWLEKAIQHEEKHGFSFGCVYEKESGNFVGRAGLIYLGYDDTQPDVEIGYVLNKASWGKGYATELARALVAWGFQHLTVTKLVGVIYPENDRSRHVLEKAGMHYSRRGLYGSKEAAFYEIDKNALDTQKIELVPAPIADYSILQNLGRFYAYDISEYMWGKPDWEMPENGLYECIDFKKYWETKNCYPFIIRYAGEIAGFVIIDKNGSDETVDFNVAQFHILRKFKGKGLGQYAVQQCFNKFPGIWDVRVLPGNEGAYRFWRACIKHYTKNHFTEFSKNNWNYFRFQT